jgi:hypothetical protein
MKTVVIPFERQKTEKSRTAAVLAMMRSCHVRSERNSSGLLTAGIPASDRGAAR